MAGQFTLFYPRQRHAAGAYALLASIVALYLQSHGGASRRRHRKVSDPVCTLGGVVAEPLGLYWLILVCI